MLFGSPISILLRPHPYCLVLPFSMLTVVFYSFPLLSLFFFPMSPCSSSPPITLQVHKIPLFSPCEIQKYPNFVTYHHFFHENLLAFQNLGIYFAPRNRNNEILSLLVSLVSPVLAFLPFHLPPRCCRGGERERKERKNRRDQTLSTNVQLPPSFVTVRLPVFGISKA